ncbi:MAG: MFS transporter [Anaerolineaceae bacterium]|nr:MFS transporter [Anaerolineaceae bacterium]
MSIDRQKNLRYNYTINLIEASFWGLGSGLSSATAILPLFLLKFTDSALLIGLIPAIQTIGFQLPQLFMAKKVASQNRFKPLTMKMTIHERLPFLGLAIIALISNRINPTAAILLIYLMLTWQGFGGGFTGNAWQNLICKIIPPDIRSMFFSLLGAGVNLLSSIGAIIAGLILEKQSGPFGYFLCFFFAFLAMMVSYVFLGTVREEEAENVLDISSTPPVLKMAFEILKKDKDFRWFVLTRFLLPFCTMASAFYTLYVIKTFQADERTIGILTSILFFSTVVSGIGLGWISDHISRKLAIQVSVFTVFLTALLAFLASSLSLFYLIFLLTGIINGAFWSVFLSFTLDFGTELERPTYVGTINTLIAPSTLIAQLLGGWLADYVSYKITFLTAATFGLITFFLVLFFVNSPKKHRADSTTIPS